MNRLELVPLSAEDRQTPPTERRLTIGTVDSRFGCAVAAQVLQLHVLTSIHVLAAKDELWESGIGKPRLMRNNPYLGENEISNLDERGLIREGVRVAADDVLASIIVADVRAGIRARRAPEEGMQWITDRTWRVPYDWCDAIVASVRRLQRKDLGRHAPRGLWERIEVVLRAERSLQVGDVLLVGDRPLLVSSFITEPPRDSQGNVADIIVPPDVAGELGISRERFLQLPVAKADDLAANVLQARNVGSYSLISQAPLGGRLRLGGQSVTSTQINWLHERGLTALVSELASRKSDDLLNRRALATLLKQSSGSILDLPALGGPESLAEITGYLSALALRVNVVGGDGCVSLGIQPASSDELLKTSYGQVTKPETIHYRTYADVDNGLFAPNIFGPSDWSRRRRFGHVQLAAPVISILWRLGSPSLLSRASGLSDTDIERVVKHRSDLVLRGREPCVIDHPCKEIGDGDRNLGTGATAIQAYFRGIADSLGDERYVIESLAVDVLPFLPPDLRPLVLLDNGNFATSDLNDLYLRIVNRNNRLRKLTELHAPQVILDNEACELQTAVDALFANSLLPEATVVRGDNGRPLVDILSLMFGRLDRHEKRVDWSGAARVIADTVVSGQRVLVPRRVFETLRLAGELPVLLTSSRSDGSFVVRLPQPHDEPVLRVSPETYEQLVDKGWPAPVAQIHRPVTRAGRDEAQRLLRERVMPSRFESGRDARSWIESKSEEELAANLASAAVSGALTPLNSPQGLLIGGTGSTQFAPDSGPARRDEHLRQVPIPEEENPPFSAPKMGQMLEAARAYLRSACVFDVQRTDEPPPAALGRVGGEPFLPPEIEWPYLYGKPLPFLGQFPLDPARNAGVLPIDVPPKSMLTIFGDEKCWEPGPCMPRYPVFVHSIENLTARPIPSDLKHPIELCEISPRVVTEAPSWNELRETLEWELHNPQPALLNEFQKELFQQLPSVAGGIKIGGWPKWVQGADSARPLLLQIAADREAGFVFRHGGTLYIFVEENRELTCLTQFD